MKLFLRDGFATIKVRLEVLILRLEVSETRDFSKSTCTSFHIRRRRTGICIIFLMSGDALLGLAALLEIKKGDAETGRRRAD